MKKFNEWLDTLIEEKGVDIEEVFVVEAGLYEDMTYGCVIDAIKNTSKIEQQKIQNILVKIDFQNGDIKHFLRHLAKALV